MILYVGNIERAGRILCLAYIRRHMELVQAFKTGCTFTAAPLLSFKSLHCFHRTQNKSAWIQRGSFIFLKHTFQAWQYFILFFTGLTGSSIENSLILDRRVECRRSRHWLIISCRRFWLSPRAGASFSSQLFCRTSPPGGSLCQCTRKRRCSGLLGGTLWIWPLGGAAEKKECVESYWSWIIFTRQRLLDRRSQTECLVPNWQIRLAVTQVIGVNHWCPGEIKGS